MKHPWFTGLSTIEDQENFTEELKKVVREDACCWSLKSWDSFILSKGVCRTLFDQWEKGWDEDAPLASLACFNKAFFGLFIPREMKEAKVQEFLNVKKDYFIVHEYKLKFTQLSRYTTEIVRYMRSRMSLFVAGLGRL